MSTVGSGQKTATASVRASAFPYRHIACAVDTESASIDAANEAARLRTFGPGELTFLHSPESMSAIAADGLTIPSPSDATTRRFQEWLIDLARARNGHGELVAGYPPAAVIEWSDQNNVDLIVAGTHRGLLDRMMLGGFASYLATHASCSVLLTRPSGEPRSSPTPFRHVAVCVDGSEPSMRALDEARSLVRLGAETLSIVHVIQWPLSHVAMGYALVPDQTTTFVEAEEWLGDLVAATGQANGVLLKGDPASAACEWAREAKPDLIVASSHRGLGERILLGSFAKYVAYHSPCEVLLTRPHPLKAASATPVLPR